MKELIAASIGGGISLLISLLTVAYLFGRLKQLVSDLEKDMAQRATKSELLGIQRDLSEIKGMFRLTLKDDH